MDELAHGDARPPSKLVCDDRRPMWPALLGAVVGGFFALAGGFSIELRRDRRRQIAAARLVRAEFTNAATEIFALASAEQVRVAALDPEQLDEVEQAGWLPGPHGEIATDAWAVHAAELVGRVSAGNFDAVDLAASELRNAGRWGFYIHHAEDLRRSLGLGVLILEPLTKPTWIDRHVWRL